MTIRETSRLVALVPDGIRVFPLGPLCRLSPWVCGSISLSLSILGLSVCPLSPVFLSVSLLPCPTRLLPFSSSPLSYLFYDLLRSTPLSPLAHTLSSPPPLVLPTFPSPWVLTETERRVHLQPRPLPSSFLVEIGAPLLRPGGRGPRGAHRLRPLFRPGPEGTCGSGEREVLTSRDSMRGTGTRSPGSSDSSPVGDCDGCRLGPRYPEAPVGTEP